MRYILKIAVIVIFSAITNLFSQPKLEIEGGGTFDWGIVKPADSPLNAKIKLWNKGNDTLKITDVKPGCGCTTAPLDKNVILPGEFATLDVSLNINAYNGVVNKNITITTNMPNAAAMLYLKANIFRPVMVSGKTYFNFAEVEPGKDTPREIVIKNNIDKEVKIESIDKLPDYCKLNIEKGTIIPPNSDFTLIATVNISQPGQFSFSLRIKTDQSKEPDLNISGWGKVLEKK